MLFNNKFLRALQRRWLPVAILSLAATATVVVLGQASAPNIPAISLSSDPLFAAAGGDKPVIALALSVEFPTVGAQYVASPGASTDATYANTKEYLGYYDAESCYTYNTTPTETPETGLVASDYKRFDRSGPAASRMCTNAFSGNFLNWASSSAIDMLRLALSGGDRYIDTPSLTILQRAVIPNGDPICMWNSGNFPAKQLQKNGDGTTAYWGAVPKAMIDEAAGSDIWVANTLNRIHFGTANGGSCADTASYALGTPKPAAASVIEKIYGPGAKPTGYPATATCNNGANCGGTGMNQILYGRSNGADNTKWVVYVTSGALKCNQTNFPGGSTSGSAQCYVLPYTGPLTAPVAPATLTDDSYFYSRVNVCNATAAGLQDNRDYKLCTPYPNGNYKPTGSIQKYSDQLRLSAFGYVMDQTASYDAGRYGGVLRAPMKFVGAKTFDISGQDNTPNGGNPNAEWSTSTGVFSRNPDGDTTQTTPISGVINYLNKFGRTGPVAGKYKKFDPVGELHYETLRYLQGLQPSADAITGLTNPTSALYDGFPITTTWTDPYGGGRSNTADYSCLKSNIVVIGDANTHDGNRLPTASAASNIPNISAWRTVVQNFEKNATSNYIDGQNMSRPTGNPNTANGSPASSTRTSQIMGSAYWSHTHDIRGTDWTASPLLQRPGLRTKTFIFDVNENASSNSAAYRQNNNHLFTAAKYGGFESDATNIGGKPYNTYGNPFKRQDGSNDNNVWQDPAKPGEASTYYLQSNARGVLSAFDSIFGRASESARSIAGSAIASKTIEPGNTLIYQSSFDTSDWSGDVLAFPITLTGTNPITIGATPTWTAATRLATLTTPAVSRNIVVGKGGATTNPVATAFIWDEIDATLQTKLSKLTPASVADTLGQDRLNYLRGDKSKEGNPFRTRTKLLGDVVNSGVVYSGAPTPPAAAGSSFTSFKTANASRTPAVFVGANDGMLHGFNANTGDELFGYIPSWMGSKLAALTSSTYNSNHQAYVDASPVVAEAQVGSTGASADWKTVLVSGTGAGGSGVFALDVTNPAAFSASNVLWEFTRADDRDMGYVVGRPQIVKMRTSAPGTTASYRWFAAVASGVNNYVSDNGDFSLTGQPALFLLALDKPVGAAWNATGTAPNYYKISLPIDSTLKVTKPTGLINFKPTVGLAGEIQNIYMGDLHGKLWKLDFTLRASTEWTMEKLSFFNKGTAASPIPYPLYAAKTTAGEIQPISMAPLLAAGPVVGGLVSTIVAFGTGKYLEKIDKTSTTQNSFYAVYDNKSTAADSGPAGESAISGRGRLQLGTVNTSAATVTFPAFRFGRASSDTDATQRSGWYFDFTASGERAVGSGSIIGDTFTFGSLIPASPGALGSCTAAGGSGNAYSMNIDSGSGTYRLSTVGLFGETLLASIPSQTTYTISTSTGRRTRTTTTQRIDVGSTANAPSGTISTTVVTGRLSWRQINNYQDLKQATP